MTLVHVPLLQTQRDLYEIPRGSERFRAYLATMIDPKNPDIRLPLQSMNPMGKEHIPTLLDMLIALNSEDVAKRTVQEVEGAIADVPGDFNITIILADDLMGGWTNRHSSEFSHRFETAALMKRGWLTGILWTSETPSTVTVRQEVLMTIYRAAHIQLHGYARNLREMLAQEGYAMAMSGCTGPTLDADDLSYTRTVLAPILETIEPSTITTCLFGDVAARSLGYTLQGLSDGAGLAIALHDARQQNEQCPRGRLLI